MDLLVLIPLLQNISLLLVFSVVLEIVYLFTIGSKRLQDIVIGILTALIGIGICGVGYPVQPDITIDTMTILLSTAAFTLGLIPTIITGGAMIVYQLIAGNGGVLRSIAMIILSVGISYGWRQLIFPKFKKWRWVSIYLMGLTVNAALLGSVLPYSSGENIGVIAVLLLVVYPPLTTLLVLVLMRQQKNQRLQQELLQSENRFYTLFEQAPMGYQSLDADGNIVDVNQRWLDMFGYVREDVLGQWVGNYIHPPFIAEYGHHFAMFKAQGKIECNLSMQTKTGDVHEIRMIGRIRYSDNNQPVRAHCILQDITDQKKAQQKLRESEEKYGNYISHAPDAIVIINAIGTMFEANDAAVKILGYPKDELLGRSIMDIVDPGSMETGVKMLKALISRSMIRGEIEYRHKDDSRRWASISGVKLSENRFLCFISDISEQKWAVEKLIYSANHDDLTGLYNRKYFDVKMEQLNVEEHLPLSVLVGDVNGLKLINDSLGHAAGDRLIQDTARFLGGFCRPDDVLARTGGDEFSILLPQTDRKTADELVRLIEQACRDYNETIDAGRLHINLAIGTATKASAAEYLLDVFKKATSAMHQRKLLDERKTHDSIITTIRSTLHDKYHDSEPYGKKTAHLARLVGSLNWLTQSDLDTIELLAEMHDIGKIGVSEEILNKQGELTEEEWEEIRMHPVIGERIAMSASGLAPIAYYILCQHERWDGTGYPQGLAGEEIPLLSRILAVVDAYDTMIQDRIYQKAMSHEEALEELKRNAGTQFDPNIVKIFCEEVFHQDGQPATLS